MIGEKILFKKVFSRIMLALFLTSIFAVAFKIQPIKAGLIATVEVIPASYTVPNDSPVNVNVTVLNVGDLYGWMLKLYYPSDILNGSTVHQHLSAFIEGIPHFQVIGSLKTGSSDPHPYLQEESLSACAIRFCRFKLFQM
jgi:hypothetical protein